MSNPSAEYLLKRYAFAAPLDATPVQKACLKNAMIMLEFYVAAGENGAASSLARCCAAASVRFDEDNDDG